MTETDEMKMCFDEMEKLKAKMEALREKRKVEEENEINRKLLMKPNLESMSTWLKEYKDAMEREIDNDYNKNLMNYHISYHKPDAHESLLNCMRRTIDKETKGWICCKTIRSHKNPTLELIEPIMGYPDEIEKMRSNLDTDTYAVLEQKMKLIYKLKLQCVRDRKRVHKNMTTMNAEIKKLIANSKQELMSDHRLCGLIESVFNIFNIMSARLDKLESTSLH